jgi:hypothetical protein
VTPGVIEVPGSGAYANRDRLREVGSPAQQTHSLGTFSEVLAT